MFLEAGALLLYDCRAPVNGVRAGATTTCLNDTGLSLYRSVQPLSTHKEEFMVILLAEDDIGVRFIAWQTLTETGFTVLTASDGQAALEKSRQYTGSIDILIADIAIPKLAGIELARIIQQERPEIRTLLICGSPGSDKSAMGFPRLVKPFSRVSLRERVETLARSRGQ